MKIKTNNVPRDLLSGYELTAKEKEELDYIENIDDCFNQFFRYRGEIYDTQEFVRIERRSQLSNPFCHGVDDDSQLLKWHGIQTDSFFSGVVIRYTEDFEQIVVGLCLT